jgi:hypothetical protein
MYAVLERFTKKVIDVFPLENYWDIRESHYQNFLKHKIVKMTKNHSPQVIGQTWKKKEE